ncbi:M14 family metallocarboxypeptidase [uncultured Metabacillus sp.]|uniref:M14 family metallopeptidase n=1 Tax=uncultured Metabacillus sp. TaxID=2860135 RepID=UPI00260B2563|nr:M14 family metallocarboxypeptidase [uncultured Metabacillus sp.]
MIISTRKELSLERLANHLCIAKELIIDSNGTIELETGIIEANTHIKIPSQSGLKLERSEFVDLMNKPATMVQDDSGHDTILNTKKPYDSKGLFKEIDRLLLMYPFMKKEIIGYSVLGSPIIELTIGRGIKKVHMNGSFHANEWITTSIMMHWLGDYLQALVSGEKFEDLNCLSLYHATTISFVPMVNPDGVDLVLNGLPDQSSFQASVLEINNNSRDFSQWKANIRGIDLNNQYPVNWEIEKERKIPKSPAPRDYPGDAPLTEPEAIALANLVRKRQFDRVLAFHTQGEEIYWGYLRREPEEAENIVNEFERLSGYKAVRDIDSHAGFRDWYVNDWRKPGYTVELGFGVNPLPFSQFDDIYRKSKGIFLAALYM